MKPNLIPATAIEQFRYHSGQLIVSRDFNDLQQRENSLRWLHNVALHNSWGIAAGFDVRLPGSNDTGCAGTDIVCINPGVAYDWLGRELILTETVTIKQPLVSEMILVMRRKQARALSDLQDLKRRCAVENLTNPMGEPEFFWRREDEIAFGIEVPLVTYSRNGEEKIQPYPSSYARPYARPRVGFGVTQPGLTSWEKWEVDVPDPDPEKQEEVLRFTVGLQVVISTTDAGFTEMPHYFAWLNGYSVSRARSILPFASLAQETLNGFTFQILFDPKTLFAENSIDIDTGKIPQIANEMKLTVCWLGIEAPFQPQSASTE